MTKVLDRYDGRLTRVEVHLSEVNGTRGGGCDKRCVVEARPAGGKPVAVEHLAAAVVPAISGANTRLVNALESLIGRRNADVVLVCGPKKSSKYPPAKPGALRV